MFTHTNDTPSYILFRKSKLKTTLHNLNSISVGLHPRLQTFRSYGANRNQAPPFQGGVGVVDLKINEFNYFKAFFDFYIVFHFYFTFPIPLI